MFNRVGKLGDHKKNALLGLGLLALCWLSYGFTIGKMGYFLDDWYIVWTYRVFGTAGFAEFFSGDRPLLGFIYRIFIPIYKDSVIGWQLFALFTKWISAITLWALLKMLLPKQKWLSYAVASLFVVYPGFRFHYFSIMYSQVYVLLSIYILSYILMVLAIRNPNKRMPLILAAMFCQFVGIAPQEYFFGFELVRPVVIFLAMPEESKDMKGKLLQVFKAGLPYLVVLAGFTLFRIFGSDLYSYQIGFIDQFKIRPLKTLITFFGNTLKGFLNSCVAVWAELLVSLKNTTVSEGLFLRIGLIALGAVVSLFFFYKEDQNEQETLPRKKYLNLIILGVYIILVSMIPFLVAGFNIDTSWSNNRFLLSLSVGVSLVSIALLELIFKNNRAKLVILALLIGVSIEANHANGNLFLTAWNQQKDFFAQLTWRAPQIKPGTVIITPDTPFGQYFSGTSLTAPLNMIYAPQLSDNPIPYQIIYADTPQMLSMPELIPDQEINRTSRVFNFIGNTSDMITIYQPEQGCLQVISPDTDPKSFQHDQYAHLWAKLIPLSDLSRIETEAVEAILPPQYFEEVSTNQWCYYFQRASLAGQEEKWDSVIEVYNQAQQHGFSPRSSSEWLPLIQASLHAGELDLALEASSKILLDDPIAQRGLCTAWENYSQSASRQDPLQIEDLLEQWLCEE